VQASASHSDLPFAAGVFAFFRNLGQTLGVVIGDTVFQNTLKAKLSSYPLLADDASLYSAEASSMVLVIQGMPPSARKKEIVKCYVEALQFLWLTMTAFAVFAGIIAALFTKNYSLNTALETAQGLDEGYVVPTEESSPPTIPAIQRMSLDLGLPLQAHYRK